MKHYTDCAEVRAEFQALLDEELSSEEQTAMEEHLAECAECLRKLGALKKATELRENLDPTTVEFERSPNAIRTVSYRPVALAAATLAMLAGVSYMAMKGIGDTPTAPATSDQPTNPAPDESSKDYWGNEQQPVATSRNAPPPLEVDFNSPEYQKKIEAWRKLHQEAEARGGSGIQEQTAEITFPSSRKPGEMGIYPQPPAPTPEEAAKIIPSEEAKAILNRFTISDAGLWTEKGYANQPLTVLKPATKEYFDMQSARPDIVRIVRHTRDIIFSHEKKWYSISHEGPLIYDQVLGHPHPKSRKLKSETEPETEPEVRAEN